MVTLFAFLLLIIGGANWLTIGLLQFDFVAGLFGSQSNIFSRIVYVLVGVGAIVVTINVVKNKGKLAFNFKRLKPKIMDKTPATNTESGSDIGRNYNQTDNTNYGYNGDSSPMQNHQQNTPQNGGNYGYNSNYNNIDQNHNISPNYSDDQQNQPQYNNQSYTKQNNNSQKFSMEAGSDYGNDFKGISNRLQEHHMTNRRNEDRR